MPLNFSPANLLSRLTAKSKTLSSSPVVQNLVGGALQNQISIANYLKGFAVSAALQAIPFLVWSVQAVWDLFVQAALVVYYFDWNAPDDALDRQAASQWNAYAGILGGAVGNTIGWITCGVLPATSLLAVNESLAAYTLREVGEEAFEEFVFNTAFVIRYTLTTLAQQGFYSTYKNVRKWLKDPENPVLDFLLPNRADEIRSNWGDADGDSFTFAQAVEERIEQIPSQFWQNFTEELLDEAFDACIEAGYVVSNSIDGYLAQQRIARRMNSPTRVVEVQPDRSNDRERIVLAGPEPYLKASLPATLAHYQLVENRDVGQIVGSPVDDYVGDKQLSLRIKFQLFNYPSPPYIRSSDRRLVRVTITVPEVRRAALDWLQLKAALGGPNGYLWGRYKAKGRVSKNQYVTVYGATPDEAEDRLRAIMQLSSLDIDTVNVTEERRSDSRLINPRLQKEATRVYPGYMTIINRQRVIAFDQGRAAIDGNYLDRKERFELWWNTPPPDFNERLQEVLRYSS